MFEPSEKREVSYTLMLTESERDYLQRMADESGLKQSDILRRGLRVIADQFERGELK